MGHGRRQTTIMTPDGERPMTPLEATIDAEAVDQADRLIAYIDTMYPALWTGAAKSARRSLRAHVYNTVSALLRRWATPNRESLEDLAKKVWAVEFALQHLGRQLHQVAQDTPFPCAFCGVMLEPRPPAPPPAFHDEASWAQEAAKHRAGCAWITCRALPGVPGYDGGPNDPRHGWPDEREMGPER